MKGLGYLICIVTIVLGLCTAQANAQLGETVVVTRPGMYAMDMADQRVLWVPTLCGLSMMVTKGCA